MTNETNDYTCPNCNLSLHKFIALRTDEEFKLLYGHKFPQLKDSPISKYPKGKIYVSENEKKVIEMVKKDRRHADKLD